MRIKHQALFAYHYFTQSNELISYKANDMATAEQVSIVSPQIGTTNPSFIRSNANHTFELKQFNKPKGKTCNSCSLNKFCIRKELDSASSEILDSIAKHPRPVHRGDHIFRQDTAFESIYIVRSGSVKVYQIEADGQEQVIGFYLAGETFGLDGLKNKRHLYSAEALDTTSLCEIPYLELESHFYRHPQIQTALINALHDEIYKRQLPLISLQQKQSEERIATFLIDIASKHTDRGLSGTEFNLPMSRRDIAHYLAMTEETISRIFARLQKRQLIETNKRQVQIKDLALLKSISMQMH